MKKENIRQVDYLEDITTVFIDWGCTLLHVNYRVFAEIAGLDVSKEEFYHVEALCSVLIEDGLLDGEDDVFKAYYLLVFSKLAGIDKSKLDEFANEIMKVPEAEIWSDLDENAEELVRLLQGRYNLAILANDSEILDGEVAKFGMKKYFKQILYSQMLGAKKPEKEIYLRACEKMRVNPKNACYIADVPKQDIGGALSVGMKGIVINSQYQNGNDDHLAFDSLSSLILWLKQTI